MRGHGPVRVSRRQAIRLLGAGSGIALASAIAEPATLAQTAGWLTARAANRVTFPRGSIIRTVLKDVSPDALASGSTMFHEHLTHLVYTSPPPPPARPGEPALQVTDSRDSSLPL